MIRPWAGVVVVMLSACFGGEESFPTVAGNLRFVQGGSADSSASRLRTATPAALIPSSSYLVSPRQGKVTFVSVVFRDETGRPLDASSAAGEYGIPFEDCTITYDRSLAAGSTLLDCPIEFPIGDVYEMVVYYDQNVELLVSDEVTGIYSDPTEPSQYTTIAPAGGADFVPYRVDVAQGTSRGRPIVFTTPVTISADAPPPLFVTTDMFQTFLLQVDASGDTLSAGNNADPIELFGGLSPGTSRYYSNGSAAESYQLGTVDNFTSLRFFFDENDEPLYLTQSPTCGPPGPLNVWAAPPSRPGSEGSFIGGYLGRDADGVLAWAMLGNTFPELVSYNVMPEATTSGETTVLNCKATDAPPEPADGQTYASGAPEMPSPDLTRTLTLIAQ